MHLSPLDLLLLTLATWRAAYLVTKESGPFHLAAAFRSRFPLGGLTTCLKCASVWAAALMLLLWLTPLQPVVYVASISGAAIMLGNYTGSSQS